MRGLYRICANVKLKLTVTFLKNHICFGLAQGQDPQTDSLSVQKSGISALGTPFEEVLWISGVSNEFVLYHGCCHV